MKTSELTGAALDWAVAKCEGYIDNCNTWLHDATVQEVEDEHFKPSTDWAQGGPIIEREKIETRYIEPLKEWHADTDCNCESGPTPLIAAMRCLVASRLGDEVDVPEELV